VRGRVESVKIVKHGWLGWASGVSVGLGSVIVEVLGVLRAPVDEGGVEYRQAVAEREHGDVWMGAHVV
tara:strand:- start:100 stop:303 length:204 start_codon:yes stop_codon:yes gene_type:complete